MLQKRRTRKRPKRTTLAEGIYQDRYGISIVVRGSEKGNRFPLGTPVPKLKKIRKDLLEAAGEGVARKGTLANDVPVYLATLPDDITTGIERRRRKSDATNLLNHWLEAVTEFDSRRITFGELPRDAITDVMVKTQLAAWRSAGVAEGTCDHRRGELGTLYNTLNGKAGYNPVRAVPKYAPTYDDPRGFDLTVMDLIIDNMPDRGRPKRGDRKKDGTLPTVNFAKIRLRVMRHCGIPPQTLKKVRPADINFGARSIATKPRRKGDGAKGRTLPLTTPAVAALRELDAHQLYGWFDQRAVNRSFKRSAKNFRATWAKERPKEPCPIPDDLHAYDLRHAFASHVFRRTGNKKIVAHLLGQTENSAMADRYVQSAVDEVARQAIALVEGSVASMVLPRGSKKSAKNPTNRVIKGRSSTTGKSRGEHGKQQRS